MMEGFGILFGLALLGAVVLLPIWIVSSIARLRREVEDDRRENLQHWQDLTARLYVLETRLKEQKDTPAATHEIPHEALHETHTASQQAKTNAPVETVPLHAPSLPLSVPEPPPARPAQTPQPEPESQPVSPASTPPPRPQMPPPTPPVHRESHPAFAKYEPDKPAERGFDLEEMLGTNWLNKIGVGILVLGLAFFLAYQLQNLGPAGKVLLGIGLSALMIAIGVRYESNDRYRILARASAAGGWALLYFVSYAIYHVPAAKVIDSRELDFFLMLSVAAAIIGYSLRYRSEATTALALVLSYLTVGIHHTSVYSLAASIVLALTVVALALRMKWFSLELFGILATYFNHLLWLWPVIEAMGPRRVLFPEFWTSVALLVFYWLLFRFSYIYRQVANDKQERLSTAAALANGFSLLALLKYQSVHPEWAFWALLLLGAVELTLAALAARRRRTAFIVLATLGSVLLVAAIPFRYSGSNLSILWLAAAEAFLLAGVLVREVVFRRIGMLSLAVVAAQMIFDTAAQQLELRLGSAPGALSDYPMAVLFATGAALCYFNSHWLRVRFEDLFKHEFDSAVSGSFTYVGGLLTLIAAWLAWPGMWTAVVWAVLALLLNVAAKRLSQSALAVQGNIVALLAIIRLITLNLFSAEQFHGISLRLVTVGATALLLYAAAPFACAADGDQEGAWSMFTAAYTWAASILVGILLWDEMLAVNVALGWMVLGLILLEIGIWLRAGFLRWQGYTALGASFIQMFVANLDVPTVSGQLSPRVTRIVPLAAAYFYADWRLRWSGIGVRGTRQDGGVEESLERAGTVFSYLGTISIAALLYFELSSFWIATGWAAQALAMIVAALAVKRRDYLYQSYLMVAAVALRSAAFNFLQPAIGVVLFSQVRRYELGAAIALLFAGLPVAFLLRRIASDKTQHEFSPGGRPEQVFFFVPFGLLTALIAFESSRGHLTVNWGIEGVAVFLLAVFVGERSFRLAGLGVLMMCVAKIFLVDVWGLDPQSRYVTLILLGCALVLVSFLYTRHKEKFRRYL
jgi:uncharacterized membrane protein